MTTRLRKSKAPTALQAGHLRPSVADVGAEQLRRLATHATYPLSRADTLVLWRNVLGRFPRQPVLAAQYIDELLLVEAWDELDRFESDARSLCNPEQDLRFVDAAIVRADTAAAEAKMALFAEQHGGTSGDLIRRRYEIETLRRRFDVAEKVGRAMRRSTSTGETRDPAAIARSYRRLAQRWRRRSKQPRDYSVFLVNLDSDRMRLLRTARQLGDTPYERIPGVKGAYLPGWALRTLTRGAGEAQKGTAGCFLSHLSIWERVERGDRPALVVEDDACIIAGLPTSLEELRLPAAFDICFVNERMRLENYAYGSADLELVRVADVVRGKPASWSSAGTDGYVVSPKGARRLLDLIESDGIAGDVDWRLISYSLTRTQREAAMAREGLAANALRFHEAFRSDSRTLKAYALNPALVRQFAGGSVRLWDNELEHSHMAVGRAAIQARR